jgi:hypothetical protein
MRQRWVSLGVAVLSLCLAACSGSSNDTVSEGDQRLMSQASKLAERFQVNAAVYIEAMSNGTFEEAEVAIDQMREASADRLELVGRIKNDKLRRFYIGIQRFSDRNITLYQDLLDATLDGASNSVIDRLLREGSRIIADYKAYIKEESRRLFDLDDQASSAIIKDQIRRSNKLFDSQAEGG